MSRCVHDGFEPGDTREEISKPAKGFAEIDPSSSKKPLAQCKTPWKTPIAMAYRNAQGDDVANEQLDETETESVTGSFTAETDSLSDEGSATFSPISATPSPPPKRCRIAQSNWAKWPGT